MTNKHVSPKREGEIGELDGKVLPRRVICYITIKGSQGNLLLGEKKRSPRDSVPFAGYMCAFALCGRTQTCPASKQPIS